MVGCLQREPGRYQAHLVVRDLEDDLISGLEMEEPAYRGGDSDLAALGKGREHLFFHWDTPIVNVHIQWTIAKSLSAGKRLHAPGCPTPDAPAAATGDVVQR
ncbi:MAG: hypothetical protein M1298_02230 [Chloroflexi bacterium]|nr:hypothetical protein [Chloroflexota bacterium]